MTESTDIKHFWICNGAFYKAYFILF